MMDWSRCIICQEDSREELRCPALSKKKDDRINAYTSFIDALEVYHTAGGSKLPVESNEKFSLEKLFENQGKWHRNCTCHFQQDGLLKTSSQADLIGSCLKRHS